MFIYWCTHIMNYKNICNTFGFEKVAQAFEELTWAYPTTIGELKKCMIGYTPSLLVNRLG